MENDAAKGDAAAQYNLGVMLHGRREAEGQPAGQNRASAIEWLAKAALQGLPRAHLKLAEVYAAPSQLPGDDVRACTWFLVAMSCASGIHRHNAEAEYDRLAVSLRPGQLMQARRDARTVIESLRRRSEGLDTPGPPEPNEPAA